MRRSYRSIARRSMAAGNRATPTIRSCVRVRPTPAIRTPNGLGDKQSCFDRRVMRSSRPMPMDEYKSQAEADAAMKTERVRLVDFKVLRTEPPEDQNPRELRHASPNNVEVRSPDAEA